MWLQREAYHSGTVPGPGVVQTLLCSGECHPCTTQNSSFSVGHLFLATSFFSPRRFSRRCGLFDSPSPCHGIYCCCHCHHCGHHQTSCPNEKGTRATRTSCKWPVPCKCWVLVDCVLQAQSQRWYSVVVSCTHTSMFSAKVQDLFCSACIAGNKAKCTLVCGRQAVRLLFILSVSELFSWTLQLVCAVKTLKNLGRRFLFFCAKVGQSQETACTEWFLVSHFTRNTCCFPRNSLLLTRSKWGTLCGKGFQHSLSKATLTRMSLDVSGFSSMKHHAKK